MNPPKYLSTPQESHTQIMDVISALRAAGFDQNIDLPQIIVCGDQSCGKSSVLSAISGFEFPASDGLCTRYPIELIMHRSNNSKVMIDVIEYQERTTSDHITQRKFQPVISSGKNIEDDFQELITAANQYIGIDLGNRRFSRDILRVEIWGPTRADLTLVDLPGLFISSNTQQTATDCMMVNKLVQDYMSNPRSIILAVVSAGTEYVNQGVTEMARQIDKNATRIMGLITKPDRLSQGSPMEDNFIKLCNNQDIRLGLGWHVLRNRSYEDAGLTLDQRNVKETEFFQTGAWNYVPKKLKGVDMLVQRLSQILTWHLESQLPSLIGDIRRYIKKSEEENRRLGPDTFNDTNGTHEWLRKTVANVHNLIEDACHSKNCRLILNKPEVNLFKRVNDDIKWFREELSQNGHRFHIIEDDEISTSSTEISHNGAFDDYALFQDRYKPEIGYASQSFVSSSDSDNIVEPLVYQRKVKLSVYLRHISDVLEQHRGRELPGLFSTAVVTILFQEQSSSWDLLTKQLTTRFMDKARDTVISLIYKVFPDDIADRIITRLVVPALESMDYDIEVKRAARMEPYMRDYITTTDPNFMQKVKKREDERRCRHMESILKDFSRPSGDKANFAMLLKLAISEVDKKMNKNSEEFCVLDYMWVYYDIAMQNLCQNICDNVLLGALFNDVPNLLTEDKIIAMTDKERLELTQESPSVYEKRKKSRDKLGLLNKSYDSLKRIQNLRKARLQTYSKFKPCWPLPRRLTPEPLTGEIVPDLTSSIFSLSSSVSTTREALHGLSLKPTENLELDDMTSQTSSTIHTSVPIQSPVYGSHSSPDMTEKTKEMYVTASSSIGDSSLQLSNGGFGYQAPVNKRLFRSESVAPPTRPFSGEPSHKIYLAQSSKPSFRSHISSNGPPSNAGGVNIHGEGRRVALWEENDVYLETYAQRNNHPGIGEMSDVGGHQVTSTLF